MKFKQDQDGSWVLINRSYIGLLFSIAVLALIPYSLITDHPDKVDGCIIFSLFGPLMLWGFAEFSTVKISDEEICYTRNWLFFKQKICCKRSDLLSVDLDLSRQRNSNGKRIKFSFADGKSIAMPKAHVGSTIGWTVKDVYQSVMEVFPELEQKDRSDEILSLVSQGKKIKAIQLVRRQYGMGLTEAKKFVEELKSNQ